MSTFAHTPESYAAWRELKHNVALGPDDSQRARHEEATRELHLLIAGKRVPSKLSLSFLTHLIARWPDRAPRVPHR